jgi:RNA polymerase sigma-70 factor (ECF subfamily)
MTEISEITIFQQIKTGDETAFSRLFDHYYTPMCFFAAKFLNDMDISRSVVQQVFVDLWIKREKLNVKHSVKSYLFQSVRNRSIDYLRQQKNNIQISQRTEEMITAPFHDLIEESEMYSQVNSTINQLPEKCREIFILCRQDGLKYSEIARELNISVKTVEMQMGIALKKIRSSLNNLQLLNLLFMVFSKKMKSVTG